MKQELVDYQVICVHFKHQQYSNKSSWVQREEYRETVEAGED